MMHMTQSPVDQMAHIGIYESVADILTVFRPVCAPWRQPPAQGAK